MIIYKIINKINGKVYIGQTVNTIKRRYNGGGKFWHHSVSNEHLKNSIAKYGPNSFSIKELCCCFDIEELNNKEKYFIKEYDSTNPLKGYNYTEGGNNGKHSSRSVEINRLAQKKYWSNPEARERQSIRKKNGICSTKEHQLKMSLVQGGKPFNVYKADTGEFVGTWINKSECARDLNIDSRNVCACLLKDKRSHKGYVFYYPEEPVIFGKQLEKLQKATKSIICTTTGEIFDSITEAAQKLQVRPQGISDVLRGIYTYTGNHLIFEYLEDNLNS